jgi:hypothetical protein
MRSGVDTKLYIHVIMFLINAYVTTTTITTTGSPFTKMLSSAARAGTSALGILAAGEPPKHHYRQRP